MRVNFMRLFLFSCLLACPLYAADPLPGHSTHGEAFDEGPRQAAVLMDGCGKINFQITTNNAEAQHFFNQGVGQLHGFWYFEAERSFRQVIALDPECAMAYWGCAMSNINNEKRAADFIKKASEKKEKTSKREQLWIEALANFYSDLKKEKKARRMDFIKDTEAIIHHSPDDLEARAFLAWAIWHAKEDGIPMVSRETVNALIEQVLAKEPMHPAHHYVIHLWDDDNHSRALASAAKCGQSAPAIAHMWHMPGHTFAKLNRQEDAEWQQDASIRVDHAYMIRTQILPDQIHNYAHNAEWLIRTKNQLGHAQQAVSIARNLIEIPRHPNCNNINKGNDSAAYGRTRLLETLMKFELWDELSSLDGSPFLDITQNPAFEASRFRALGIAAFFKNDHAALKKNLDAVLALKEKAPPKEKDKPKEKAKAKADATASKNEKPAKDAPNKIAPKDPAASELKMLDAIMSNNREEAAKLLDQPGDIPKERLVRYQLMIENKEKASKLANELPQDAPGTALRVDVLAQCGKDDEAKAQFEKLQTVAATMDEDLPITKRMNDLAPRLGFPVSWRKPPEPRSDTGVRPPLESLGPMLWHPWNAPSFSLTNQQQQPVSLQDFAGKPVIVLFYLGHTCGHCIEQLKAFTATAKDFASAGISLVAIGCEPADELLATRNLCGNGDDKTPLALLADPEMKAFREWRCYDDFEGMPLHGAFLVDSRGLVRWADISSEPFKDTGFLLEESKRLLKF